MSQRWLKFLKKFGSGGQDLYGSLEDDYLQPMLADPKMHGRYDVLFHLFGPVAESPWVPYHCPTLFASIDKLKISPKEVELSPGFFEPRPPGAWEWLRSETMVIVDASGSAAIEAGVMLMGAGAQPISTFDHWPYSHQNRTATTLIQAEEIINTMFTLAPKVVEYRKRLTPDSAPMWLCDSRRMGGFGKPTPGTFDNRYYIDDSILAGIDTVKKAGVRHLIYLSLDIKEDVEPDLVPLFIEAHGAGISIEKVALRDNSTWVQPLPMEVPFKTKLPIRSFKRSDMGGFGQMVPVASEGGSYSSGGGGG